MIKSIIFTTDPESPLIKSLQEKGSVIVAENEEKAIKTLRAMKKTVDKENYTIVADENSKKYLEVAKKLGYKEHKEVPKIKVEEDRELVDELIEKYNTIKSDNIKIKEEQRKWEEEKAKIEAIHKEEIKRIVQESEEKRSQDIGRITKESEEKRITEVNEIKRLIQKAIYE